MYNDPQQQYTEQPTSSQQQENNRVVNRAVTVVTSSPGRSVGWLRLVRCASQEMKECSFLRVSNKFRRRSVTGRFRMQPTAYRPGVLPPSTLKDLTRGSQTPQPTDWHYHTWNRFGLSAPSTACCLRCLRSASRGGRHAACTPAL